MTGQALVGGGAEAEDAYSKYPHLSNLNQDPSLSGSLKLIVTDNTSLKIGRKDADVTQDVQLEGLGMKKEHCIITNRPAGGLFVKVAEPGADVYLNGTKLGDDEEKPIQNKDLLVFGVCTHLYQVVVPRKKNPTKPKASVKPQLETFAEENEEEEDSDEDEDKVEKEGGLEEEGEDWIPLNENGEPEVEEDDTTMTYQEAVRQVVLGRPETAHQKQVRLAHLVLSQWRRPVFKRLFEERLVEALRFCQEANQIATEMCTDVKFTIHLTCAVRLEDTSSMNLREIIKYEYVHINIRASRNDSEDNPESDAYLSNNKDWVCECGRVAFGEFVDTLRSDYQSLKPLCNTGDMKIPQVLISLFQSSDAERDDVTFRELYEHLKELEKDSVSLNINRALLLEHASAVVEEPFVSDQMELDKEEAAR